MSNYTQEGGLFKIDTPLGKDVLAAPRFHGHRVHIAPFQV